MHELRRGASTELCRRSLQPQSADGKLPVNIFVLESVHGSSGQNGGGGGKEPQTESCGTEALEERAWERSDIQRRSPPPRSDTGARVAEDGWLPLRLPLELPRDRGDGNLGDCGDVHGSHGLGPRSLQAYLYEGAVPPLSIDLPSPGAEIAQMGTIRRVVIGENGPQPVVSPTFGTTFAAISTTSLKLAEGTTGSSLIVSAQIPALLWEAKNEGGFTTLRVQGRNVGLTFASGGGPAFLSSTPSAVTLTADGFVTSANPEEALTQSAHILTLDAANSEGAVVSMTALAPPAGQAIAWVGPAMWSVEGETGKISLVLPFDPATQAPAPLGVSVLSGQRFPAGAGGLSASSDGYWQVSFGASRDGSSLPRRPVPYRSRFHLGRARPSQRLQQ